MSEGLSHTRKHYINATSLRYPQILWMSSVTPNQSLTEDGSTGPQYWRSNLESPVRFSEAMSNLVGLDRVQVLIEVGPHPTLESPLDQILKASAKTSISYLPTLRRYRDGHESMLQLAGILFCLNANVEIASVNEVDTAAGLAHGSVAIDLPTYQ